MKSIIFSLLLAVCAQADDVKLNWSFNRTNGLFTFSWQAQSNVLYEIVRYDIGNEYYHKVFSEVSTSNAVMTARMNPFRSTDEDVPLFSGQGWFYLVEMRFTTTEWLAKRKPPIPNRP